MHSAQRLLTAIVLLIASTSSFAAPQADKCAKIAGEEFVVPSAALACLKSFPFNETLRQNVLSVVDRVFDFYTLEDWYLDSPPPFQGSTVDIREEIARINSTDYEVGLSVLWRLFLSLTRTRPTTTSTGICMIW